MFDRIAFPRSDDGIADLFTLFIQIGITAVHADDSNSRTDADAVGRHILFICVDCSDPDLYEKGEEISYTIVGARESDPVKHLISNDSAIGSALLGKVVGDTVKVLLPDDQFVSFKLNNIEARK